MASAYGYKKEVDQYINPYDTDFILNQALWKQQKYDDNAALINEQIRGIAGIDLFKDVDQEYLNSRLQKITAQLNATGADLSNSAIASNMQNYLMRAIDSNVKEAIDSTSRARKDLLAIEKAQEANDGTYNVVNAAYTKSAIQDWANSPTMTTRLTRYQSNGYTPYTDVLAETDKLVSDFTKQRGSVTVDEEYGGYIIRRTTNNWTDQEVRAYVENNLSTQAQQQLQINGWYKYGQSGEQGIYSALSQYAKGKDEMYTSQIGALELQLNSLNDNERIVANQYLSTLRNSQLQFRDNIEQLSKNPGSITYFLEREGLVETMVNKYAPSTTTQEIKKNDTYFASEKLRIDQQRLYLDAQKVANQANNSTKGSNNRTSSDTSDGFRYYPIAIETESEPFLNRKETVLNSIEEPRQRAAFNAQEIDRIFRNPDLDFDLGNYRSPTDSLSISDIYNSTISEVRNELIASGSPEPAPSLVREIALDRLLENDQSDIMRNASAETLALIQDYKFNRNQYERNLDSYSRTIQPVSGSPTDNIEALYSTFFQRGLTSNSILSNIPLPGVPESNLGDYIREQWNINSAEDLRVALDTEPFLKRYLDETIGAYGLLTGLDMVARQAGLPQQNGEDFLTIKDYNTLQYAEVVLNPILSKFGELTDSNVGLNDLFDIRENPNGTISLNPKRNTINNSTLQTVINREATPYRTNTTTSVGRGGLAPSLTTQTTTEPGGSISSGNRERIRNFYFGEKASSPQEEAAINDLYGMLPQNYQIQIFPDDSPEVAEELQSFLQLRGVDANSGKRGTQPNLKNPVSIRLDPENPGGVLIEQVVSKQDSKGILYPSSIVAKVGIGEISPNITSTLNLDATQRSGQFPGIPVPTKPVGNYLSSNEDANLLNYYQSRGVSPRDIELVTYSGAYNYLSTLDGGGWINGDFDTLLKNGRINQSQYNYLKSFRTNITSILNSPDVIEVGTHRNNGRTVIDLKIGNYSTKINTDQVGNAAESLENSINSNRLVGLTTALGALLVRSQTANRANQTVEGNTDLKTLNKIFQAYQEEVAKKGVVIDRQ